MEGIGLKAILDDSNFQKGLAKYQQGVSQMEKSTDHAAGFLSRLGSVASGAVVVGIGAATAAFAGAIAVAKSGLDATLQWAEQLDKLGDQFGLSGEQASGWAFLMNKVGLSVDEGAQGLNYFTKQLDDFGKASKSGQVQVTPFLTALQKLGVRAYDTKGKLKDFDTIMPEIMDRFQKLPAGINASALAMDLFGARGGTKFLDFLRQGGAGLKDATAKAKALGLELSTDEVNAAEDFGFAMNELNLGLLGFRNTIGRQVLPIAKELVRWISTNAIPRLTDLARKYIPVLVSWFRSLGDWVDRYALPRLREFTNWIRTDAIPLIARLTDAFRKGGVGGLFNQMLAEIRNAWPGIERELRTRGAQFWNWITTDVLPPLPAKMGAILTGIRNWIQQNGPGIIAAFQGFAANFWSWVTSPGGVVATTAGNLVNVVAAIASWVGNPANTKDIRDALTSWVGQFWEWITNPESGVLVTISENMDVLTTNIAHWANSTDTQKKFGEIGASLARAILDGMGQLFSDQREGDTLMQKLWRNLLIADRNIWSAMLGIGRDISTAILSGLASLFTDPVTAQNFANTIIGMMQNAIAAILRALPAILQPIRDFWNNFIASLPSPSAPSGTGAPTGLQPGILPSMLSGGRVPRDMLARLHAGEYVIPAGQVSNMVNNSRMIMPGAIVFQIQGGSNLTEHQLENVAYRVVSRVMDAA